MSSPDVDLGRWLPARRWFQGKDREIVAAHVVDGAALPSLARWLLLDVGYADGSSERYQLVLVPGDDASDATVSLDGHKWADATAAPFVLGEFARLAVEGGRIATNGGAAIVGTPRAVHDIPVGVRTLDGEQSNTSVILGEAAVLKLFRRVEAGVNPEVELTAALTDVGNADVPAQFGALHLSDDDQWALGVVSGFVSDGRDAWRCAVGDAAAVLTGHDPSAPDDRAFIGRLGDLGAAVARVHADLARALPCRDATTADVAGWVDGAHRQIARVLGRRAPSGIDAAAVHTAVDRAAAGIAHPGIVGRIHGDLHLGQVLDSRRGWQVLDFEGEPAKSLDERRAPGTPARDLAGMLRSFDYAAATGLRSVPDTGGAELPAALAAWRDAARKSFLAGYAAHAGTVDAALLAVFELDKAVYEIGYERANRPDWLGIPVGGVRRIVDRVTP